MPDRHRPRRRLAPALLELEGRRLLSALPPPAASMTQTATFPDLESLPDVATQALLYFSASMGTLTEVDVVTSGSYSTEFHAENLGTSNSAITGTTTANLSINGPGGSIPVTIPPIAESFSAAPFDGTLDYGGTSGKDFAAQTSNSAPVTTVLTSPADLAAFTGNFRIPISVSGHAIGSATASDGAVSAGFNTQTSATITVIYHYNPNLPSLDLPTGTGSNPQPPGASGSGPVNASSANPDVSSSAGAPAPTGTVPLVQAVSGFERQSPSGARKKKPVPAAKPSHNITHQMIPLSNVRKRSTVLPAGKAGKKGI
jgi:hypothetical protein